MTISILTEQILGLMYEHILKLIITLSTIGRAKKKKSLNVLWDPFVSIKTASFWKESVPTTSCYASLLQ